MAIVRVPSPSAGVGEEIRARNRHGDRDTEERGNPSRPEVGDETPHSASFAQWPQQPGESEARGNRYGDGHWPGEELTSRRYFWVESHPYEVVGKDA